jgi:hypothetical protein
LHRKAYIIGHSPATDHCRKRAVFEVLQWRVFGRRRLCPEKGETLSYAVLIIQAARCWSGMC